MPKIIRNFRLTDQTKPKDRNELLNQLVRDVEELEESRDTEVRTLQKRLAALEGKQDISGFVLSDGAGGVVETFINGATASIVSTGIQITFNTPLPNTDYIVTLTEQSVSPLQYFAVDFSSKSTSSFRIEAINISTGVVTSAATNILRVMFQVIPPQE